MERPRHINGTLGRLLAVRGAAGSFGLSDYSLSHADSVNMSVDVGGKQTRHEVTNGIVGMGLLLLLLTVEIMMGLSTSNFNVLYL